jgi:hypothetical protein
MAARFGTEGSVAEIHSPTIRTGTARGEYSLATVVPPAVSVSATQVLMLRSISHGL